MMADEGHGDETHAAFMRRRLLAVVGDWYDAMVKAGPRWNDGDMHTLELLAGVETWDDDDRPLVTVRAKAGTDGSI